MRYIALFGYGPNWKHTGAVTTLSVPERALPRERG